MSSKQVSRTRWVVAFILGYFGAFLGTALLTYVGQNPMWVWVLFVLVGIWLWQLPVLKGLDTKLSLLSLFTFPFLGLWMFSNPTPASTDRVYLLVGIVGLLGLGTALLARSTMAMYRKNPPLRKLISACMALFLCGWLIAFFSASTGAAGHWVQVLVSVFHFSAHRAEEVAILCRKSLHFLFYGIVGFCAYRTAVRGGAANRAFVLALLMVLFFASFDEIRQSAFSDRTASFWDVCLDLTGGLCLVALAASARRARRRRSGENSEDREKSLTGFGLR